MTAFGAPVGVRHASKVTSVTLPTPNIVDPSSVPSLRWGILGPGSIAGAFATTVLANTSQRIVAVASQTPGRAEAFAVQHAIDIHLASYAELVARDDVDAVYIANQPNDHASAAIMALEAGKPVLVEKPFTKSVAQAQAIFDRARDGGLLAMEAMWTRYLPQMDVARQLLASGAIGEPRLVRADFSEDNRSVARLWRKGHGSPLWDMGIYPIALSQMVLGEPASVHARGIVLDTGIDAEVSADLSFTSGARASLTVSGLVDAPLHAVISGEDGVIVFADPYIFPTAVGLAGKGLDAPITWWRDDSGLRRHAALAYQVTAFADYVGRGLLESPLQSHEDSLACLRVAEEITRCLGADT